MLPIGSVRIAMREVYQAGVSVTSTQRWIPSRRNTPVLQMAHPESREPSSYRAKARERKAAPISV